MKKTQKEMQRLSYAIMLVILLISLIPAIVVFAQELTEPYWKCAFLGFDIGCPPDSAPTMILYRNISETHNNNPGLIGTVDLYCTPPECEYPSTIYLSYYITADWIGYNLFGGDSDVRLVVDLPEAPDITLSTIGCPKTDYGSCMLFGSITIPAEDIWDVGSQRGRIRFFLSGGGNIGSNIWTLGDLTVSLAPPECEYTEINKLADGRLIDPLVEYPIGAPDDEQIVNLSMLADETILKLTTYGGPWNDSEEDRYDTAVSFDEGETWIPLGDLEFVCISPHPEHPDLMTIYFILPDGAESMQIRVNDDAEAFEDNLQIWPLYYDLATVTPGTLTGCLSQFVIQWDYPITTKTVDATNAIGEQATYWTPSDLDDVVGMDEWFVLVIDPLTSQGWTTPEIAPDEEQVIQMRYETETGWHSMTPYNIDDYHIWCGEWKDEPDGTQYYFFMPFERIGYYRVDDTFGLGDDADFADNSGSVTFTIYPAVRMRPLEECEIAYKLGTKIQEWSVDATAPYGVRALKDWRGFPAPTPGWPWGGEAAPRGIIAVDTYGAPFIDPDCNGCFQKGMNTGFNWNYRADMAIQTFDFDNDTIDDIIYGNPLINDLLAAFNFSLLDWSLQKDHPKVVCAVKLSPYHWRTYLDLEIDNTEALFIRAHEAGYGYDDNTGYLSYRIWEATEYDFHDPGDPPLPPGGCAEAFTLGGQVADLYIDAREDDGILIPTEPEQYYAVETKNGPWQEGGEGDDLYGLQIGDGSDWDTITDSSRILCVEQVADSPYIRFYLRGNLGTAHRLRVDDSDIINWSINSGSMGADVYGVSTASDPWEDCSDGFPDLSTIPAIGEFTIPANSQVGTQVPALVPGYAYAIAITGGDWADLPDGGLLDPRRDVQVTQDNGANWYPEDDFDFACAQKRNGYLRFYFTYQSGHVWRLRVNDDGDAPGGETLDWLMNTGQLTFKLYSTNQEDDIPGDDGGMYCNEIGCLRPSNWLDIGAWVEYARCGITRYMTWCPRHTDALIAVSGLGRRYEPWASIISMIDILDFIRDEFRAYVWTKNDPLDPLSTQDGQARGAFDDLVQSGNRNSPWNGGQLYFGNSGEFSAATTNCTNAFATIIGTGGNAFRAFCWTTGMIKIVNIQWPFLNIIISAGAVIFGWLYFTKAWVNQGQR